MKEPHVKPVVALAGEDGNAFSIMGKVCSALGKAGADREYVQTYLDDAKSGDYDNLLVVTTNYVDVV